MKRGLCVGSGQRPHTSTPEIEWCNVDCVAREGMPKPDLVCDATRLPFRDESADYYVLHHVLEHFGCGEGKALIDEAYRVLKPGGSLLVFVPDLRALALGWLKGRISTQIYTTCLMGAFMGNDEDRHKWNYDSASMQEFLTSCVPWTLVREFDWRTIPGADIARDWWILSREAIK